jgi:prolyl oligopeptidase
VPAHSFKFAAELQEKQTGTNPTLIRIDINAGHGAGKSVAATIQENVDIQAFTLYNRFMTIPATVQAVWLPFELNLYTRSFPPKEAEGKG